MRDYFIIGLIAVALCGCTSPASRARNTYALLDDVSVPQEPNYDYKVVAVDGKPVERMHGYLATYVPYAVIEPGNHTLSLDPDVLSTAQATTLSASFEAGKTYRIKRENETVTVVEEIR
jgi:hypothetical protein